MSIVGFQDFWVAGSRFFYKRDAIEGAEQPWIDLGVIQPVNPSLEIEKLELEDSDGGVKKVVDERVTKIDETYDITCSNLNMDNLALLFLANPAGELGQTRNGFDIEHGLMAGRLKKIVDSGGTPVYGLSVISGVYKDNVNTDILVTSIDAGNSRLNLDSSPMGEDGLDAGERVILMEAAAGLDDPKQAKTYTITARNGTPDYIEVAETVTDDVATSNTLIYASETATIGTIYAPGTDWEAYNTERGFIRIPPGSSITDGDYHIVYGVNELSGARLANPQSFRGEIQGQGILIWGRGNFQEQTAREARISITPSSANIQIDDFSNMVLSVKIISDLLATDVAGRIVYFDGDLPTTS